jgi:hypothetical protein
MPEQPEAFTGQALQARAPLRRKTEAWRLP